MCVCVCVCDVCVGGSATGEDAVEVSHDDEP